VRHWKNNCTGSMYCSTRWGWKKPCFVTAKYYYPTLPEDWESIWMGSDLTVVTIKTHQGSEYIFPDVPRSMLENVIKGQGWNACGIIVLVNVSGASMSMPSRIAATLSYDGEVRWTGSAA
jgi:hypothetical protein